MAKKAKNSETVDEYKKIRYTGVVQKFFSITFEIDRQRLLISSAGLGFMMTRIPLDKNTFSCFLCVDFLIDALWIIACGAFLCTMWLMLQTFKKEKKYFEIVMEEYVSENEREIEKLKKKRAKFDGELDIFNDRANFSFEISILSVILFVVLKAVLA